MNYGGWSVVRPKAGRSSALRVATDVPSPGSDDAAAAAASDDPAIAINDDNSGDGTPDAEQVEEDWKRALDAAQDAVTANREASSLNRLDSDELAKETKTVHDEREWLARNRAALRKLLPKRPSPKRDGEGD
jgi:hypothetical protein